MLTCAPWRVDRSKILTRRELAAVLADLNRKAPRSPSTRPDLVVFRLACRCGLRASEIAGLRLDDVVVTGDRPHLRIRRNVAKGGRRRTVPLWWARHAIGPGRLAGGTCGPGRKRPLRRLPPKRRA